MQGNNQPGNQGSNQPGGQKGGGLSWSQSNNNVQQKPIVPIAVIPQQKPFTPPLPKAAPIIASSMPVKVLEKKSSFTKLLIIFLVGAAAGFLLGWWWTKGSTPAAQITTTTNTTQTTKQTTPVSDTGVVVTTVPVVMNDSILVPPLQDAGKKVTVTSAPVTKPTWVVVYDDLQGQPGKALGAVLFFPSTKGGTIELIRATLSGKTYFVGERVDNGDFAYSAQKDSAVMDADGKQLLVAFQTR